MARSYRDAVLVLIITVLYHTMNQMFVPTLPVYITERGGDPVMVGLLVGLVYFGSVVAKGYFGRLSTRRSNLLVLRIGLFVATGVIFLYFPFWGFGFLALVRLIQSVGLAGYITGAQGLLAEQTRPHNRGFFFGVFAAMIGVGMTIGPLLGSFLAENFGYNVLFSGAALSVGLSALLSLAMGKGPGGGQVGMGRKYKPHSPWKNPRLLVVCGTMLTGAAVIGATSSMLALQTREVGLGSGSLFFVLFALTFTLGGAVAGTLSDKFGAKALVVPGFALIIVGMLCLVFLSSGLLLLAAALSAGLGLGCVNAVLLALVPSCSINSVDASNDLAFFSNAFDLGVVFGSFGLSFLAARSYSLFWLAVAVLNAAGLVFYLRFDPERKSKQAQV